MLKKILEHRIEETKIIEAAIDKMDRVIHPQIPDHEYVDTCDLYKFLQKRRRDLGIK